MKNVSLALCLVVVTLMAAGCASRGNLVVTRAAESLYGIKTVEVKCDPNLFYEWSDTPDLKDVLLRRITARLQDSGLKIVREKPDITIVIKQINTSNEIVYVDIAKVVVMGIKDDQEVLRVEYSQNVESLTLQAFLHPSRNQYQVADLLTSKVIQEIRHRGSQ